MTTRGAGTCLAIVAVLAAGACASTSFVSTWTAPDAKATQFKPGDKIVAMVMSDQVAMRRSGEANIADVLDGNGFKAMPAYTLIPDDEIMNEPKAKERIEASDAVGVVVLRPRGSEKETTTTTNWYSAPYYGGFWGSGYYGSGWGSLYGTPGTTTTRTDVYVTVETMVYDLRRNKLVWAGRSKTTNPKDVEDFVLELSKAVGPELRRAGVVAGR